MTTETWTVRGRRYYLNGDVWTWEPVHWISNADRICELLDQLLVAEARIDRLEKQVTWLEGQVARDGYAGA